MIHAVRKFRPARIVPKDADKAIDDLCDAWADISSARASLRSAQPAIGSPSKWSGDLAKLRESLLEASIRLEDIIEEIRELRKRSRPQKEEP